MQPSIINEHHMKESSSKRPSHSLRWLNLVLIGFSLLMLTFITTCYYQQFDHCAAITVYPSWVWALFGIAPLLIAFNKQQKRTSLVVLFLWLCYFGLFADTPTSLLRIVSHHNWHESLSHTKQRTNIRVITLNCSSSSKSILALKKYDADIILIQESCGVEQLQSVAQKLYEDEGSTIPGIDASVIVQGNLTLLKKTGFYIVAIATLQNGKELGIISLRLTTPPLRGDLWNRECWEIYKTNRVKQRKELQEILNELSQFQTSIPIIIGGDFNAPPHSDIFQEFPNNYQDSFKTAGVGWGNSITNDFPFLRIDQLWSNQFLQPIHSSSLIAIETDHRLVIADFRVTSTP